MSKLTLHVDDELIAAAKDEAAARQVSVSKLVSDFFRVLSVRQHAESNGSPLPPMTQSLIGCIQGADIDKEHYIDHLEAKHS